MLDDSKEQMLSLCTGKLYNQQSAMRMDDQQQYAMQPS